MTTEQYLLNNRVEVFGEYGDTSQMEEFAKAMQEYTRIKCKELLEIVAEKAEVKTVSIPNGLNIKTCVVDKDSILNVIDLEKFCGGTPSS